MFAPGNEHLASRSGEDGMDRCRDSADAVLTGLQDVVAVPENGLKIAKERPNTWLVGIPECGHNMVFEQPEAIKNLVVSFIHSDAVGVAGSTIFR